MMASNMTSNKSIQFLDKSVDFSMEKEDSISLTGGGTGTGTAGSASNVRNVLALRSPDYLLNDGSLVNLESIDKSAVHDS